MRNLSLFGKKKKSSNFPFNRKSAGMIYEYMFESQVTSASLDKHPREQMYKISDELLENVVHGPTESEGENVAGMLQKQNCT